MEGDPMKLTDEEAQYAWKVALNISRRHGQSTLGPEDFAAQAIERLLQLENMPINLEGWLKAVITNLYIDRQRHIDARRRNFGKSFVAHEDEEIAQLIIDKNQPSMSSELVNVAFARVLLDFLLMRIKMTACCLRHCRVN